MNCEIALKKRKSENEKKKTRTMTERSATLKERERKEETKRKYIKRECSENNTELGGRRKKGISDSPTNSTELFFLLVCNTYG